MSSRLMLQLPQPRLLTEETSASTMDSSITSITILATVRVLERLHHFQTVQLLMDTETEETHAKLDQLVTTNTTKVPRPGHGKQTDLYQEDTEQSG